MLSTARMNSLPLECDVRYQVDFLNKKEADNLFNEIVEDFDVTNKIIRMFDGSEHVGETGIYLFADPELTSYEALPEVWGGRSAWTASLEAVRDKIYRVTGHYFQVARSVYYQDGSEGVDFHTDPPAYGDTSVIASLSLGVEREFVMRKIDDPDDCFTLRLAPGSLLIMGAGCRDQYQHALPKNENCLQPRLNLTFRKYGWDR